jgi:DNA repair exonuclease SbcCD ATPase subunit
MKKVEFLGIGIKNFKAFAEARLDLEAMGPGLHFIRGRNLKEPALGSNGSGKSSIWDALCWCLYGRTVEGLRNPDITPWFGKKRGTEVTLEMRVDGKTYILTRSANPNMLHLQEDGGKGEAPQSGSIGQEQVERLVGLSFETFTHTRLLGQGRPLFFDMPPRDKLQLFSDVLELDKWERRAEAATAKSRALSTKQATRQGELDALTVSLERYKEQLEESKIRSREWEDERQIRLAQQEKELTELKKARESLEHRHAELDPKADWAEVQLKSIRKEIASAVEEMQKANSLLLTAQGNAERMRREIRELRASLSDKVCPTCGQPIKSEIDKTHVTIKIEKAEKHLKKISTVKLEKAAAKWKRAVRLLKASAERWETELENARQELDLVNKSLETTRAQIAALERTRTEREEEDNPYTAQLQSARKLIAKTNAEIKELKKSVATLGRLSERAAYWSRGFKDVRLFIIEDVLQELEINTNAALEDVGLIGWQVKFDVEKENKTGGTTRGLNVTVLSPGLEKAVKWESWSGGEGQRLRIVGALALSETLMNYAGVECGLEILDEPTQHLSPEGVRDLCDYLAQRAQGLRRQTFYVDHQSVESARFASVLTVIKTPTGASQIEG